MFHVISVLFFLRSDSCGWPAHPFLLTCRRVRGIVPVVTASSRCRHGEAIQNHTHPSMQQSPTPVCAFEHMCTWRSRWRAGSSTATRETPTKTVRVRFRVLHVGRFKRHGLNLKSCRACGNSWHPASTSHGLRWYFTSKNAITVQAGGATTGIRSTASEPRDTKR